MVEHVRFITLGCKVNQYETQAMRELLSGVSIQDPSGLEGDSYWKAKEEADKEDVNFVVINTCTVTHVADRENRYWIRRAKREHPKAKIVVTGCYVEKNRSEIEALPDVDLVVSNYEKDDIAGILSEGCGSPDMQSIVQKRKRGESYDDLTVSSIAGRTRAYVKVQDGCNHSCSFCKVVLVRGRSRSRDLDSIENEVRALADSGHKEIVLTGIQLGAFGLEWDDPKTLRDAIRVCSSVEGIERIRLSSIEPTDISDEVIEELANNSKCCPHLHIPLQSGDSDILKGMNRRYERQDYIDLIAKLRLALPDFMLTLDVMAGFAGESEENFQNTVKLLEEVKPLKCHVFPYSAREGTRAAQIDELPKEVVKNRVKLLMGLEDRLGQEISQDYVGKTLPVLVEGQKVAGGLLQGLTSNYLKVCFQGDESLMGKIIPVQFLTLQGRVFLGRPILEY